MQEALPPPRDRDFPVSSMKPWMLYDRYVQGTPIQELAILEGCTEAAVVADVSQMRDWLRLRFPYLNDEELDSYRREHLLAQKGAIVAANDEGGGQAAAIKVVKECQDKQEELARLSEARAGEDII